MTIPTYASDAEKTSKFGSKVKGLVQEYVDIATKQRKLAAVAIFSSAALLTACSAVAYRQYHAADVATDELCEALAPIEISEQDTQETVRQVVAHNAIWQELCGGGGE